MAFGTVMITGATGLIGSHVAAVLTSEGWRVRALVRPSSRDHGFLRLLGVELVEGDVTDKHAVIKAMRGATHVVHCAAVVGDWGPPEPYHEVNVQALVGLLAAARKTTSVVRLVMMSSLGVYEARDHFGTDESVTPNLAGIDPYTRTKVVSEAMVVKAAAEGLPAVILRPGFVYGPRDRQVLPRLITALRDRKVFYFGSGLQRLNNTGVRNIAEATRLALNVPGVAGEIFNITDDPLATRREFIGAVARAMELPEPQRSLPLWMAKPAAFTLDRAARALGAKNAPPLSMARYKFLALNLEYSIAKAKQVLGYRPVMGFEDGIKEAVAWWQSQVSQ